MRQILSPSSWVWSHHPPRRAPTPVRRGGLGRFFPAAACFLLAPAAVSAADRPIAMARVQLEVQGPAPLAAAVGGAIQKTLEGSVEVTDSASPQPPRWMASVIVTLNPNRMIAAGISISRSLRDEMGAVAEQVTRVAPIQARQLRSMATYAVLPATMAVLTDVSAESLGKRIGEAWEQNVFEPERKAQSAKAEDQRAPVVAP